MSDHMHPDAVTDLLRIGDACIVDIISRHDQREPPEGRVVVDCHYLHFVIDQAKAEAERQAFEDVVQAYLAADGGERLRGGPSYIEAGGIIGDQSTALGFFALGEALGRWRVVTPERLGVSSVEGERLAGNGFVMITGLDK